MKRIPGLERVKFRLIRLGTLAALLPSLAAATLGAAPLEGEREKLFSRFGGEFADTGWIRTHYFEYGDRAAAETILFLHGFASTGIEASCVASELVGAGYRLVAPDWPGTGLSGLLPEYSAEALVAWLEEFRAELGIERLHIVGHSYGGFLAIRYAARYPERVDKLVLIAPAGFEKEIGGFLAGLSEAPGLVEAAAALYIPPYYELIAAMGEYEDFSRAPKAVLEYNARSLATPKGRRGMSEIAHRIVGGEPDVDCLDEVAAPTLLLWAEDDRVLPYEWHARFLEGLPPSTLFAAIADCGHAPHKEKPAETAAIILGFLGSAGLWP